MKRLAATIITIAVALAGARADSPAPRAFWRIDSVDGRDTAVSPDGTPHFLLGCCWVHPRGSFSHVLGYSPYGRFCETNYPSKEAWAEETLGRLSSWGFNCLGAACDIDLVGHKTLAHAANALRMGQNFATGDPDRSICPYGNAPGTALPNVFHPDWPAHCEAIALEKCAPNRDDPWLLGYHLDNELAWGARRGQSGTGLYEAVAALPESHSAKQALLSFLARQAATNSSLVTRHSSLDLVGVSNADKVAFLRHYAERYFAVACDAVRRHDPNHLILGCRFAGLESAHPVVWEEAGRHCDAVSVNVYPWADLDRGVVLDEKCGVPVAERFHEYHGYAQKPLYITEWSFPALDTGRVCLVGAGQRVNTQEERAEAAALFLRTMRDNPHVIGCDWFMWCDRPAAGSSKWNPEDCNYGLVNEKGVPYEELVSMFARIHSGAAELYGNVHKSATATSVHKSQIAIVSERDLYFMEAAHGKKHARGDLDLPLVNNDGQLPFVNNFVGFRQEADGKWTLSNAFVRLSGSIGSRYMADEIAFGDTPVGCYGACLHAIDDGTNVWLDAVRVTDVAVATNAASGAIRVGIRSTNDGDGIPEALRFAVTHRLSVAPGSRDILAEIVSLENLGDTPLFVKRLFLRPYSLEKKPVAISFAPSVWHGPCEAAWRLPDGGLWGVSSRDDSAVRFRFFVDRAGDQHPDARFAPDARAAGFTLAPGAVWRPELPHSALIHLFPQ